MVDIRNVRVHSISHTIVESGRLVFTDNSIIPSPWSRMQPVWGNHVCRLPKEKVFEFIRETVKTSLPESAVIEMEQFYRLYTQSDELINVVDCRSKEEYDSCHISNAYHLVLTA